MLYRKNGEWFGTITTSQGAMTIRTNQTDRHEAEKIVHKKQAMYSNSMAAEQRRRERS